MHMIHRERESKIQARMLQGKNKNEPTMTKAKQRMHSNNALLEPM
jgi:hypothetical protein